MTPPTSAHVPPIGGCGSTSCVMAARDFGIPASGTMAHSWVQMFPDRV